MSAYGTITRAAAAPDSPLVPRSFVLPNGSTMTVFPCTRATVEPELIQYLAEVFAQTVQDGRTYPQIEVQTTEEFAGYFFGQDCFVGLLDHEHDGVKAAGPAGLDREPSHSLEQVRAGRTYAEAVLGMFYVKPNYPGRSSHNCNGGFVVPTVHRGLSVGKNLGRAYLHYAPKLGYKGSVFNLVYVNNHASVKIWDSLGFTRAGLIPHAGLLKAATAGEPDEYVDAIVFHKSFF